MTARRTRGSGTGDHTPHAAGDRALLIGLTGPIGCGKSTVAGWLAARGGFVINADAVARDVTAPGQPGHDAVLAEFGDAFRRPDGTLDRAALGRAVFDDPAALRRLERIVHPLVRPRIEAMIGDARASGAPILVLEAIKLIEGGYGATCDAVWLITCDAASQQARLVGRGLDPAAARQRARAQAGMTERLAGQATTVIDTSGTLTETRERVERALAEAGRAAATPGGGRTGTV